MFPQLLAHFRQEIKIFKGVINSRYIPFMLFILSFQIKKITKDTAHTNHINHWQKYQNQCHKDQPSLTIHYPTNLIHKGRAHHHLHSWTILNVTIVAIYYLIVAFYER